MSPKLQDLQQEEEYQYIDFRSFQEYLANTPTLSRKESEDTKLDQLAEQEILKLKEKYRDKPLLILDSFRQRVLYNNLPKEISCLPAAAKVEEKLEKLFIEINKEFNKNFNKEINKRLDSIRVDGFEISVRKNFQLEEFINLFELNFHGCLNSSQSLIKLFPGSKLKINSCNIFLTDSLQKKVSVRSTLKRFLLEESSELELNFFQPAEDFSSFKFGFCFFEQAQKSKLKLNTFLREKYGFSYQKFFNQILNSQALFEFNGLQVAQAESSLHSQISLEHQAPGESRSSQNFRSIVFGQAKAEFTGEIKILPEALKTEAQQLSKALVLSREAKIYTRPRLQILADDVKCSHGATVGQISAEQLFYLQSRGIPSKIAQELLLLSFASEITQEIGDLTLRKKVSAQLRAAF